MSTDQRGGKSAAVVLEDAETGSVLKSLVPFSMPITGQVCFSNGTTDLGATTRTGAGLHREGESGRGQAGVRRRPSSLQRGYYIEPTVFADVDCAMTIAQEDRARGESKDWTSTSRRRRSTSREQNPGES